MEPIPDDVDNQTKLDILEDIAKKGAKLNLETYPYETLAPVVMMNCPTGIEMMVVAAPHTPGYTDEDVKRASTKALQWILKKSNAVSYAYILEGWGTKFVDSAKNNYNNKIKDMPPDDRHDIVIIALVEKKGTPKGVMAIIDSLPDGSRSLRDWEDMAHLDGRLILTDW